MYNLLKKATADVCIRLSMVTFTLAVASACPCAARADSVSWIGTGSDTKWTSAGNWNPNLVPNLRNSRREVYFNEADIAGSRLVSFSAKTANRGHVYVNAGTSDAPVVFQADNAGCGIQCPVNNSSKPNYFAGNFSVGNSAAAYLMMLGGSYGPMGGDGYLGCAAGRAVMVMDGSDVAVSLVYALDTANGKKTFYLQNGGLYMTNAVLTATGNINLGCNVEGAANSVAVAGRNSRLHADGALYIGHATSSSTVVDIPGGEVSAGGNLYVGYGEGSNSEVLNFGTVSAAGLYIGAGADLVSRVRNMGGEMSSTGWLTVGGRSGAEGDATDVRFEIDGGSVTAGSSLAIGDFGLPGSKAEVIVRGGATLSTGSGYLSVAQGASGSLDVYDGTVSVATEVVFCNESRNTAGEDGTLSLHSGGVLSARALRHGSGAGRSLVLLDGGTLKATSGGTFVAAHANLSVRATSGGGTISTGGNAVTIAEDLDEEAGETGSFTFVGGDSATLSGKVGYTGSTGVEIGTTLKVPNGQSVAAILEGGVSVVIPEILPSSGIFRVFERTDGGVFSAADLTSCSFADSAAAQTHMLRLELSEDSAAICVIVPGNAGSYVWTGGGDTVHFSDPANWSGGIAPTTGGERVALTVETNSTLVCDIVNFRPASLEFIYGSAAITVAGARPITTAVIENGTDLHHVIESPVQSPSGRELTVPSREDNYLDFAGGVSADSLLPSGSRAYLKGRFVLGREWKTSERDYAVLLSGSRLEVPAFVADVDPAEIEVQPGSVLSVARDATLTSSTNGIRALVDVNNGCVRVGGDVIAAGLVRGHVCRDGVGTNIVRGICCSSTYDHFKLNSLAKGAPPTRWIVGEDGLWSGEDGSSSFWIDRGDSNSGAAGSGAVIQASADFTIAADIGVRQPLVIDTTGPDGVGKTVTVNGVIYNIPAGSTTNDLSFVGCGKVVANYDTTKLSPSFSSDIHIGGETTLEMPVGACATLGDADFAAGASLVVSGADAEGKTASFGGALSFGGGNTVFIDNLDITSAPVLQAASVSAAGPVDFVFDGDTLHDGDDDKYLVFSATDEGGIPEDFADMIGSVSGTAIPEGGQARLLVRGNSLWLALNAPAARVGDRLYYTLEEAAADSSEDARAVLLRDVRETVRLDEGERLCLSEGDFRFSGVFSGSGTVNFDAAPAAYAYNATTNGASLLSPGWTGTFQIGWTSGTVAFVFDDFGTADSTVEVAFSDDGRPFLGYPSTSWKTSAAPPSIATHVVIREGTTWLIENGWGRTSGRTTFASLGGGGDLILQARALSPSTVPNYPVDYHFTSVACFTGTLGGGVRDRAHFSFGDIVLDDPQFGVPVLKLDATAQVDDIGSTLLNGAAAHLAVGTENGQRGVYLARALVDGTGYVSIDDALAAAEAAEAAEVDVLDGSSDEKEGWEWDAANRRYTRYVADVAGRKFAKLSTAITYAADSGETLVTLLGSTSDGAILPEGITLDCGIVPFGGTVDGSGTLRVSKRPVSSSDFIPVVAETWTGRFVIDWAGGALVRLEANRYGNTNSVVEVTHFMSGYARDDSSAEPYEVAPVIDVSGSMLLDNRFADYSNPLVEATMKETVFPRVTGEGRLTFANASCSVGTFDNFYGIFATTNGYDEAGVESDADDEGAAVGAILTTNRVEAGVCFLRTTATTRITTIDDITVNGIHTNLIFDAVAKQPGLYLPGTQVISIDSSSNETVEGMFAFFSSAADVAGGVWLVSLLAPSGEYVMSSGESVRVRDNGFALDLVAPSGTEIVSEPDTVFADSTLYTCVSTAPEELYEVAADGVPDGVEYTDGAGAFTAAFAAEGSVITVTVLSGDGPTLDGGLAERVERFFIYNAYQRMYTMYRDSNADVFMVAASDVSRLRDAGVGDPTAVPPGWSMSYAQAAALGLLSADGLDVAAEEFAVTSIAVDRENGTAVLTTNGKAVDAYDVVCLLVAKENLSDPWPDVSEAVSEAAIGEPLVDPDASDAHRFYRVVPVISNR